MQTYIISEAKPKLGALVKQAAAGKVMYLLNGKDMVALVPARLTHDSSPELGVASTNEQLEESEKSPTAPWNAGDAVRLAKQITKKKGQR